MQVPICRHIKTNGEQCHAARMRQHDFCYFHHRLRSTHRATVRSKADYATFDSNGNVVSYIPAQHPMPDLGPLEDRAAIQVAISTVINALASRTLDTKRAATLLYGLQLASNNAPPANGNYTQTKEPLEGFLLTPEGESLAFADRIPDGAPHFEDTAEEWLETSDDTDNNIGEGQLLL